MSSATAAGAGSPTAGAQQSSSSSNGTSVPPPLLLPTQLSKGAFYLSPLSNPDLVLTLIIPGHPSYGGHTLPHTASEAHLHAGSPRESSSLAKFFGSVSNSVTNTASGALGVKNQLELNKPKLKLVPRVLPTADSSPSSHALNQRWVLSKQDGCMYSCVEEKEGGACYRLGFAKNQMLRVRSIDGNGHENGSGASTDHERLAGASPASPADLPSATTRDSSRTGSGIVAAGKQSSTYGGDAADGDSKRSGKGQLISVTTARGDTVVVPRRWEVHDSKPLTADRLKDLTTISGLHVVIEDLEGGGPAGGLVGVLSRAASAAQHAAEALAAAAGAGVGSSSGRDTSRLLIIKDSCCGNLDCELEKIDAGASCGFKSQSTSEEARLAAQQAAAANGAANGTAASAALPPNAALAGGAGTLATRGGPNIKQIWRVESDFSVWLSSLSRSVSTEYGVTRKLQKVEAERARRREETPTPEAHVPFKLTIDYHFTQVWSTEGLKSTQSTPVSIWRPTCAGGAFFGDYAVQGTDMPDKKDAVVVGGSANSGQLHRALVRPVDFELVWSKKKGKMGNLYIWNPLPPPGVDALALGHIASTGKNEQDAKPLVSCGVVLVLREYLKDTQRPLDRCIWSDANLEHGVPGALWKVGAHMRTFMCNPGTHAPPAGSFYALLEPQEAPEKCPLLRPMETMNAEWTSVWDDRGTMAKMDISVWRPKVSSTFVRFGDQVTRGHTPPSNLAVVARDHPAFKRPASFVLATKFYRGARKCYVWRPVPPSDEYVPLGYAVTATKDEGPPLRDVMRCVHRDALIPLGVLKQMWIEHHNGMLSTFTLGVSTLLTLSKNYPVNMLWKNRSLNTFFAVQNTHARPDAFAAGNVYRLTMTANELAHTVGLLEQHARWVLESIFLALQSIARVLEESNYRRLSLSPKQAATLFQSIKGVFRFLRGEDDEGAPSFETSPSFRSYLAEFESQRLRGVEKHFKRYLYQTILEDVADNESTLECLDDDYDLLMQLSDVHRTNDGVDEWTPPCKSARWPASQLKSLQSLIMDDCIGREISERFVALFPPRVGRGMDTVDDESDAEEDDPMMSPRSAAANGTPASSPAAAAAASASGAAAANGSADLQRSVSVDSKASSVAASGASSAQLAETKATLDKLSTLSAELDTVISVTTRLDLRKRYLEYYQTYLTHTLSQEFPVSGSTARSAATGHKLGMSSLLCVVGWVCDYIELVTLDLLEGDTAAAAPVLEKMNELVDRLMDVHDDATKQKVLGWVSNLLKQEERSMPELRAGQGEDRNKSYYFTSGPSDLFLNLNTLYDSQSTSLHGRPLARIALVHVHVLTYYQQVQSQFFKQLRAVKDSTTHETVKGKTGGPVPPHAGSLDKPYAFLLAQINNARLYQANVDEFSERVLHRLGDDDLPDDMMSMLEDAFATCGEEFETLSLGATEVLIRHICGRLHAPLSKLFTDKIWWPEPEYLQSAVLDELDELCSFLVPNIEPNLAATHLVRETAQQAIRGYIRALLSGNLKQSISNSDNVLSSIGIKSNVSSAAGGAASPVEKLTLSGAIERIRADRSSLQEYADSCHKWNVSEAVAPTFAKLDTLLDFLTVDPDFLKLQVTKVQNSFQKDADFPPALVLQSLLSLRADVSNEDKRAFLAPYAAELKALEDARKAAAAAAAQRDPKGKLGLGGMLSKSGSVAASSPPSSLMSPSSSSSIGSAAFGLEVYLEKGTNLVIKDTSTSDPYVNILLLDSSRGRLAKVASKVQEKTLNPVWNEAFTKFKLGEVAALDRIRFEVWDKDFLSKDWMGSAEVSVAEIREKQLIERRSLPGRGSASSSDHTQEPISFHLKLQPREGKENKGKDAVSGHIDVRIRYFKIGGSVGGMPPVAQAAGKGAASHNDDLDFGIEHVGQTGSKRPRGDSAERGAAPPPVSDLVEAEPLLSADASASSSVVDPPPQQSSSAVIDGALKAPLWNDIVGKLRLKSAATSAFAAGNGNANGKAAPAAATAAGATKPTKRFATLRGGAGALGKHGANSPHHPAGAADGADGAPRKTLQGTESAFDIFKMF